jgi:hypothetical protein
MLLNISTLLPMLLSFTHCTIYHREHSHHLTTRLPGVTASFPCEAFKITTKENYLWSICLQSEQRTEVNQNIYSDIQPDPFLPLAKALRGNVLVRKSATWFSLAMSMYWMLSLAPLWQNELVPNIYMLSTDGQVSFTDCLQSRSVINVDSTG